jgi:hypothetical protein
MKRNQQATRVALSSGSTGFYETTNSVINPSYIRLVVYNDGYFVRVFTRWKYSRTLKFTKIDEPFII